VKKFILLIIMLMFYSCSTYPRISAKQEGVDPVFKPYVEEYRMIIGQDEYKERFKKLHINFAKLSDDAVGRCWWLGNGGFEIEIDPTWWQRSMFYDAERRFVMYHELEHCIRYRLHTNRVNDIDSVNDFLDEIGYYLGIIEKPGYLKDGCPASLMHSHVMSSECRQKHYTYYIEEMINH
jgi:hypothetical protein